MNSFFKLLDIKNEEKNGKIIEIPAIQRGLVWSAKQIEFLWDSIFRRFPIGGFVVAENDRKYSLLDGQQRFKAISLAFQEPNEAESSVLWWDISPEREVSTRKFILKVTNLAQPWGFRNDDECSPLSAGERRDALTSFFNKPEFNVYREKYSLSETYPFLSHFPIPLSFFLKTAASESEEGLLDKIKTLPDCWLKKYWTQDNQAYLKENYMQLRADINKILKEYTIPFSVLQKSTIEAEENESECREETYIEILFNRLGSMGTQITKEELAYSAIKSYWSDITKTIEKIAKGFLPPHTLTMIIFRLVLTEEGAKGFRRNLSISQIREYAKERESREKITLFCKADGEAERIVKAIKKAFDVQLIPKHLILKMGKEMPEGFLLAMYFIQRFGSHPEFDYSMLIGLLLMILWFGDKSCITLIVDFIYSKTRKVQDASKLQICISDAVFSMMGFGWISIIYSPNEIVKTLSEGGMLKNGIDSNCVAISIGHLHLWEKKTLLLYAQREFINENYCNYDPLDSQRWKDEKCPWDYDHILPQSWIYKKRYVNRFFRDWAYTVGNLAAIPFEVNRSKSDSSEYWFYEKYSKELFFDMRFKDFDKKTVDNEEKGRAFAKTVFDRFVRIYGECFDSFSNFLFLRESEKSERTRKRFEQLKNELGEKGTKLKARFVLGSLEYEIEHPVDWNRQWVSFEYDVNNYCVVSITMAEEFNLQSYETTEKIEVGIRKHPSILNVDNDWQTENEKKLQEAKALKDSEKDYELQGIYQGWWYLQKNCSSFEEAKELFPLIVEKTNQLVE